ncbi:MAG TPA: hypothetical protein VHA13_03755, partial [Gammaproteobacteria bacterium]|nr:hypothetical protein [Gammaproteobacteria bacterium]
VSEFNRKANLLNKFNVDEKNNFMESCLSQGKAEHGYHLLCKLGCMQVLFADTYHYLKEDHDWIQAEMKNTAKHQSISMPIVYSSFATSINRWSGNNKIARMSELFNILEGPKIAGHMRAAAERREQFYSGQYNALTFNK